MRALVLCTVLLALEPSWAEGIQISCYGSPEQAVLTVPEPADAFLHVMCTKYGHVLAPTVDSLWVRVGTSSLLHFPAQMVRENAKETGNLTYFKSITVTSITGPSVGAKWSIVAQAWPEMRDPVPEEVMEIVAETNDGGQHKIYIFRNALGYSRSYSPISGEENAVVFVIHRPRDRTRPPEQGDFPRSPVVDRYKATVTEARIQRNTKVCGLTGGRRA